jgi:NADH-quinone oxidoreductase subunit L
MFRLYILAFRGASRLSHEAEHHLHESPRSMIVPLVILAVLSVVGGWVGPPMQEHGNLFHNWLAPVFAPVETHGGGHAASAAHHEVPRATEWLLIVLSVGVALAGIALAFRFYLQKPAIATSLRQRFAALHRMLLNKYWVDELYDGLFVRPVHGMAMRFWRFWDETIVDGTVNGVAYTLEGMSAVLRLFQTGFVGTYALFFVLGVLALLLHYVRNG